MGRDLLAQDYLLKQITASLIYPEDAFGKIFWNRVYQEAFKRYGTTNIPVNTFNKVWIVPEKAVVYENAQAGTAYVVESRLKVMLEQDYLALEKNVEGGHVGQAAATAADPNVSPQKDVNALGSQIVREIVIPQLTKEVNENKNFAQLRQVYNSLILATWYKKKIKDSILSQVYADKNKVKGVEWGHVPRPQAGYVSPLHAPNKGDTNPPAGGFMSPESIYQQYLTAFKKGVYNYIKEEQDPQTQQIIPRKYFSGGMDFAMATDPQNKGMGSGIGRLLKIVSEFLLPQGKKSDTVKVEVRLDSAIPQPGDRVVEQSKSKVAATFDTQKVLEHEAALRLLKEKGFPVFNLDRITEIGAKTEQLGESGSVALGISQKNAELVSLNRSDIKEKDLSYEVDAEPLGVVECRLYKQIGKNGLSTLWSDRLIPIMGEGIFHTDGRLMNDDELRQAGLALVKDDHGQPVTVRGLVKSERTVSLPGPWVVPYIRTAMGEKVLSTYQEISKIAGNTVNADNITETLERLATEGRISLRLAVALDFKGSGRYKFRPNKSAPVWLQDKVGQNVYVPALPNESVGDENWPTHGGVGALRETEAEHLSVQSELLSKGAVFSGLEIASSILFDHNSLPELAGNTDYQQVVMNQRVTFTMARASLFLYEWASDSGASLHTETLIPWLKTIYGIEDEDVLKGKFLEELYKTFARNLRAALLLDIYRDARSRMPHNWGPHLEFIDLGGLRRVSEFYDIREWEWILIYVETCLGALTPRTTEKREGSYMSSFFRGRYFNEIFLPAIFSDEDLSSARQYFNDLQRRGALATPSVLLGSDFTQRIRNSIVRSQDLDKAMKVNQKGGIDLTPANLYLQTRNSGGQIKFHIDPAMLEQLQNAPGFVPMIISIQPMNDLRLFLGIEN